MPMTKPLPLNAEDGVVMNRPTDCDPPKGAHGTVLLMDSPTLIFVRWGDWDGGFGESSSDYWVERKQLRKLPARKEVL